MAGLPDIPSSPPSDRDGGAGVTGPGMGISPDRGEPGPAPGGDAPGSNIRGAWPGDLDGDEMSVPGRDLLTEHLAHGGTQVP